MKVLAILGSPRRYGNTALLTDKFLEGCTGAGHETKKIFLREKDISFCRGCEACTRSQRCVINDDMAGILNEMLASQVIVLATPVYFYSITGLMKNFIDRCLPIYTDLGNKDYYFISAMADTEVANMDRAMASLRGFTDCIPGARVRGEIRAPGVWKAGEVQNLAIMTDAYSLGLKV